MFLGSVFHTLIAARTHLCASWFFCFALFFFLKGISVHRLYNVVCVCCCPRTDLSKICTIRVVKHMSPVKRGGRMQRYYRQRHTFLAFSLRRYYFHLLSHNIVHQADTFPTRKCKAIKITVKNIRSGLRQNTCHCQRGAALHACVD